MKAYLPYTIKKNGSIYEVIATSTGLVQFTSLKRDNCKQWITNNSN